MRLRTAAAGAAASRRVCLSGAHGEKAQDPDDAAGDAHFEREREKVRIPSLPVASDEFRDAVLTLQLGSSRLLVLDSRFQSEYLRRRSVKAMQSRADAQADAWSPGLWEPWELAPFAVTAALFAQILAKRLLPATSTAPKRRMRSAPGHTLSMKGQVWSFSCSSLPHVHAAAGSPRIQIVHVPR